MTVDVIMGWSHDGCSHVNVGGFGKTGYTVDQKPAETCGGCRFDIVQGKHRVTHLGIIPLTKPWEYKPYRSRL